MIMIHRLVSFSTTYKDINSHDEVKIKKEVIIFHAHVMDHQADTKLKTAEQYNHRLHYLYQTGFTPQKLKYSIAITKNSTLSSAIKITKLEA